ncbi:MAG TPA: GNAT family N-acetyltransferase [Vicinamibacteria bacterium]|nr:GNAT family N-acetyltransferase [Vicinamibacteria bacterium]
MELQIREARPEDAAAITEILNPIIEAGTFTALDTPFSVDAERAFLEGFPSRGIFHVAVDGAGRLVGFQDVSPFADYTRAFDHVGVIGTFVDLAFRRRGIAGRLFRATFDAARLKGYEKFFTFIRADNPAALATYQRHGFEVIGTAKRQAKTKFGYVDEILVEAFL